MSLGQRSLARRVPDPGIAPMQIERFGEVRNYAMCKVAAKRGLVGCLFEGNPTAGLRCRHATKSIASGPVFRPDEATASACLFSSRGACA
jgi:hypothetical protein